MRHIIMFSGGVGSWAAAKRVTAEFGTTDVVLLFADTRIEDEDTYRWLTDAAANVGAPLVRLDQGKDIWQVFREKKYLGNTVHDPCSDMLKRRPSRKWVEQNCIPSDTVLYLGYDWTELNRIERTTRAWNGWTVRAPMAESPYLTKPQMLSWSEAEGIAPQRLYVLGFPHANCGGGCVKAGPGAWLHLLRTLPERYAEWEAREEEFRAFIGKDVAMLSNVIDGTRAPLTLRHLRELQAQFPDQCAPFADAMGGCGCFTGEELEQGDDGVVRHRVKRGWIQFLHRRNTIDSHRKPLSEIK